MSQKNTHLLQLNLCRWVSFYSFIQISVLVVVRMYCLYSSILIIEQFGKLYISSVVDTL